MTKILSSFRDPAGHVYEANGVLYRVVNDEYMEHYDHLMSSGLYSKLTAMGVLIFDVKMSNGDLLPERIPFISYPYEWCFSQLKDAALVTLEVQKIALDHGMVLKDASAYNVQFKQHMPILIDTLSFEKYREGEPWVAYKQFCQHFVAPLALMAYIDVRLGQLLRVHLDGIPLDLASKLLPTRTKMGKLFWHLCIHAKAQQHFAERKAKATMSLTSLRGLIDSLESCIRSLKWEPKGADRYYKEQSNYSDDDYSSKQKLVKDYLSWAKPDVVWDLGANTGIFSKIAAMQGRQVVAFDSVPECVEALYQSGVGEILPLLVDLTNPSPGIGWECNERLPLWERGHADVVMALALIHHLAIANNVPLSMIAEFFARLGDKLIVEFVPKSDSNCQTLLRNRADIFGDYTQENFEREFSRLFKIVRSDNIGDSERVLYLMEANK